MPSSVRAVLHGSGCHTLLRKRIIATNTAITSFATYHSSLSLKLQPIVMGKNKRKKRSKKTADKPSAPKSDAPAKPQAKKSSGSLADKLRARLAGGRFRSLNEALYTNSGGENFRRFQAEPELAEAYHRGFREQARGWPRNPLDDVIAQLKALPRAVVADMGCGDARLAAELGKRHDVRSFDLVATAPGVIACNIERTPLTSGECDVVVFCLALMGPSLWRFVGEAFRVLKPGGLLKVVEVRSRFEDASIDEFVAGCRSAGFDLVKPYDASNRMFVAFDFQKSSRRPSKTDPAFAFRACVYKKR